MEVDQDPPVQQPNKSIKRSQDPMMNAEASTSGLSAQAGSKRPSDETQGGTPKKTRHF